MTDSQQINKEHAYIRYAILNKKVITDIPQQNNEHILKQLLAEENSMTNLTIGELSLLVPKDKHLRVVKGKPGYCEVMCGEWCDNLIEGGCPDCNKKYGVMT